jgi:hypothetical protein
MTDVTDEWKLATVNDRTTVKKLREHLYHIGRSGFPVPPEVRNGHKMNMLACIRKAQQVYRDSAHRTATAPLIPSANKAITATEVNDFLASLPSPQFSGDCE